MCLSPTAAAKSTMIIILFYRFYAGVVVHPHIRMSDNCINRMFHKIYQLVHFYANASRYAYYWNTYLFIVSIRCRDETSQQNLHLRFIIWNSRIFLASLTSNYKRQENLNETKLNVSSCVNYALEMSSFLFFFPLWLKK